MLSSVSVLKLLRNMNRCQTEIKCKKNMAETKKTINFDTTHSCKCEVCTPNVKPDAIQTIYFSLVSNAISAYYNHNSLLCMPQHLINYLPVGFLTTYAARDIDAAWEKLPFHIKTSFEVAVCKRCTRHYKHRSDGEDDFDGPNPMIKQCEACKKEFKNVF